MTTLVDSNTNRAAAGAALLDRRRPGWADRIDLAKLRMSSCGNCVLGQVSDHNYSGLLYELNAGTLHDDPYEFATEHGFDAPLDYDWDELERAWLAEIMARQT